MVDLGSAWERLTKGVKLVSLENIVESHFLQFFSLWSSILLSSLFSFLQLPFSASTSTMKIEKLNENAGFVRVELTEGDLKEVSDAVPADNVPGANTYKSFLRLSWKYADTPPKDSKTSA